MIPPGRTIGHRGRGFRPDQDRFFVEPIGHQRHIHLEQLPEPGRDGLQRTFRLAADVAEDHLLPTALDSEP